MVVWNEENKKVWAQHNNNVKIGLDETYIPVMWLYDDLALHAHVAQQEKKQHCFINQLNPWSF